MDQEDSLPSGMPATDGRRCEVAARLPKASHVVTKEDVPVEGTLVPRAVIRRLGRYGGAMFSRTVELAGHCSVLRTL